MKTSKAIHYPKYLALAAGLIGFVLRSAVFFFGTDAKGLPIRSHWANITLLILTVAAGLFFAVRCHFLPKTREYREAYPASVFSGIGCLAAAIGFFLADAPDTLAGSFRIAEMILRCGAALALAAVAYCRFAGKKPLFLLHGLVCLYLMLRLICLYRLWSSDPQLIDYGFYLGAYVALILTGYQLAAFDADAGNPGKLWFFGTSSVYLCAVSLSGPREPFFMLVCVIWIMTNLCSLKISLPVYEN